MVFLSVALSRKIIMIQPVIMAGGSGSRLWPLSRGLYPKQFLALHGQLTMLQQTISRLDGVEHTAPIVICNEEHRFLAAEQLHALKKYNEQAHNGLILEPFGRNTAPAIALAALKATNQGEDPILLVLAADHVIENEAAFCTATEEAKLLAEQGKVVTFGIVATHPETGYGYIQKGEGQNVVRFVEKPNLQKAEEYTASGNYFWNSGMFMVKASVYLEALNQYAPEILTTCQASMESATLDLDFIRPDVDAFAKCPDDSIDYAVMEPLTEKQPGSVAVVPLAAGWSDVGSFSTLYDISEKDGNNNVIKGDVLTQDSHNNLIRSDYKMIATVGVEDLVVISTKDAVLVANKNKVQEVKHIVNRLKEENRTEHKLAREVFRPWGKYDSIDMGDRFQVKRITVKPGEKVSVQMHHHRAEHWIVVKGTALITINGEGKLYSENEAAYIPITATHCMENPGKIDLEIIEVQTGGYLGEDDIVRFEDAYGRASK
jgi:mannose-1-phosphate guanylyltransferase/mannose-6-phosphate isomerase